MGCGAAGEPEPVEVGPQPPAGWDDGVRLPTAVDRNTDPNVVEIDLEARRVAVEYKPGVPVDTWTYGGGSPGPSSVYRKARV